MSSVDGDGKALFKKLTLPIGPLLSTWTADESPNGQEYNSTP